MKKVIIYITLICNLFVFEVNATTYYTADEYGNTGSVKCSAADDKLVLEWYNFKYGLQNYSYCFGFYLSNGISVKGGATTNVSEAGNIQIYGKATGDTKTISSSYCFAYESGEYDTKKSNGNATVAKKNLTQFGVYNLSGGCCYMKLEHYHHTYFKIDASDVCGGKEANYKYISYGSATDRIISYKGLGGTIKCDYSKCPDSTTCDVWYKNGDAVNSTTCSKINKGTCAKYDTVIDSSKKVFYLNGTNFETGEGISATCDASGNCQF